MEEDEMNELGDCTIFKKDNNRCNGVSCEHGNQCASNCCNTVDDTCFDCPDLMLLWIIIIFAVVCVCICIGLCFWMSVQRRRAEALRS